MTTIIKIDEKEYEIEFEGRNCSEDCKGLSEHTNICDYFNMRLFPQIRMDGSYIRRCQLCIKTTI